MPYIPWADYGICKFWMLRRCYSGDSCTYAHPPPPERKRLWEEKTAEQDADAARGIPRPRNPGGGDSYGTSRMPTRSEGDWKIKGEAVRQPSQPMEPARPTEPVQPIIMPAQPPPARQGSFTSQESTRLTEEFGHLVTETPQNPTRLAVVEPAAPEVSMLVAPSSPAPVEKKKRSNANEEPLGRPNRLQTRDGLNAAHDALAAVGERDRIAVTKSLESGDDAAVRQQAETRTGDTSAAPPRERQTLTMMQAEEVTVIAEKEDESKSKRGAIQASRQTPGSSFDLTPYRREKSPTDISPPIAAQSQKMGASKRMSNGEVKHVGPHPSTIRVSARYLSQAAIEKKLQPPTPTDASDVQERLTAEAREDSVRLQGCRWLDDVRRAMQLPIRTFTTACTYYHKFRLAHPQHLAGMEYGNAWADACAASLLTACKVEDTLKKSRDVLAAAHNLRAAVGEQVGTDDAMFEAPSRAVIGLERLVLEAGAFDFRSKYPHELMVKIAKTLPADDDQEAGKVADLGWSVLTDLHRTLVPVKQTSATMAVASLELGAHLHAAASNDTSVVRDSFRDFDFEKHSTSREEVMETILDALDLYTHHTLHTILGSKYSLDDFLRIRLAFNKECSENNIPRFTTATPRDQGEQDSTGNTLRIQNGHPTPVSPPQPGSQTQTQHVNTNGAQAPAEGGETLRFMLNPQLAADEKTEVQKYFVEEWEEYEEEIEVPLPRPRSPDRNSDRASRGPVGPPAPGPPRVDPRDRPRERYDERRGPRYEYDERRYDDRRYDDRRGGRYEDRRFDDRRRERR